MEYSRLINRAFNLSWQNKSLWIFGLFAGMGMNTNFDIGGSSDEEMEELLEGMFDGNFDISTEQIVAFVGFIFLLSIFFFATRLIASPALIDGVNKIARGGVYRFSEAFSRGVDFFLREFILTMLALFTGISLFAVGVVIIAVSVAMHPLLLIFGIPLALVVMFGGGFVSYNIFSLAERALVVRDVDFSDALQEGYMLFRRHLGTTFIFFLVNFGLMIGVGMLIGMIYLMISLPFFGLLGDSDGSFGIRILIGFLLFAPLSFLLGGWSGTFFHTLYTLFYFELVEPHQAAVIAPLPDSSLPDSSVT